MALIWLLVACSTSISVPPVQVGFSEPRAVHRFDDPQTTWDTFSLEGDQALFRVNNGVLEGAVVGNRGYIWSLSHTRYDDVGIEATVQQTRGSSGNGFGLMCRADSDGNGYYFVISSDGRYSILKAQPDIDNPLPLVTWQDSPALRQGTSVNQLRAVCVGDRLLFHANGELLAESRDQSYSAGQIGVVLGAVGQTAWVSFDDITVRDASIIAP